jgi:uncharacterized membrane protein
MTQQRVDTYLDQLERELSDLPRKGRSELVAEIRDHVDQALAAKPDPSEADVLNVLERLGDPADIAEEARERFGVRRATPRWTDWMAVFLLPFGGLLPSALGVLGWFVGAIFLLTSRVWSTRDKMIGLLLFPGGLLLPVLLLVTPTSGLTFPPILGVAILIVLVSTPIVVAIYLSSKLRARTDQSP